MWRLCPGRLSRKRDCRDTGKVGAIWIQARGREKRVGYRGRGSLDAIAEVDDGGLSRCWLMTVEGVVEMRGGKLLALLGWALCVQVGGREDGRVEGQIIRCSLHTNGRRVVV